MGGSRRRAGAGQQAFLQESCLADPVSPDTGMRLRAAVLCPLRERLSMSALQAPMRQPPPPNASLPPPPAPFLPACSEVRYHSDTQSLKIAQGVSGTGEQHGACLLSPPAQWRHCALAAVQRWQQGVTRTNLCPACCWRRQRVPALPAPCCTQHCHPAHPAPLATCLAPTQCATRAACSATCRTSCRR